MTKQKIIDWLLQKLDNKLKLEFIKITKNGFWRTKNKYISDEFVFQFFAVRILRQNNFTVVVNEKSGNRSFFEQFIYKLVGNKSGIPDLFVLSKNNEKGYFLELKKSKNEIYKKNGDLRKLSDTKENQLRFIDNAQLSGYKATFLYPENLKEIFADYFGIEV